MLNKEDSVIKNYLKKVKLIEKYNKFYYDKDSPSVSDQQYDELKKKILDFEKNNSFLKKYTSINAKVGFKPSSKFGKMRHVISMLSLANAFNKSDVEDFIKKLSAKFKIKIEEVEIIKENIVFKVPAKLN